MKKIILLICILLLNLQAQCLEVLVQLPSFKPTADAIGGNKVKISTLMGSGSNPHTFSMIPSDLKRLETCNIYILSSLLEPVNKKILAVLKERNPDATVLNAEELLANNGDTIKNPHNWLSLKAHSLLSNALTVELQKRMPLEKNFFTANNTLYQKKIADFKAAIQKKLLPFRGRIFYSGHAVFTYFATENGIVEKSIATGGSSPSARTILRLIKAARKEHVKLVIVQKQFNPRSGKIIAQNIGGKVLELDHLQEDIFDLLQKLTNGIELAYGNTK